VIRVELAAKSLWRDMYKAGRYAEPVDVFAAAEHLGLDVVYWEPEEKDLAGVLIRSARTIFVNASLSAARIRFTVAHELGHYVLGHGDAGCPCPSRAEEEREADRFAAALLLPAAVLRSMWFTWDCQPAPPPPPAALEAARLRSMGREAGDYARRYRE
jgi:Zn-dependent peptidase ImmA (M78 family)